MKSHFAKAVILGVVCVGSSAAVAADVSNSDAEAHTLEITESGERMSIVVDAGQTVTICEAGCFLTAPNGDRIALQGGESISLVGGAAIVQ